MHEHDAPQAPPEPASADPGPVGSTAADDRAQKAVVRHAHAVTRRDATVRREDWADYVGRADTDDERATAARDLDEDQRDADADDADADAFGENR